MGEPFTYAFTDEQDNALTDLELTVPPPVRKGREVTIKVGVKNVGKRLWEVTAFSSGLLGQIVDQQDRTFDGEPSNLATEKDVRDGILTGPADYTFDRLQPGESGVQTLRFDLPEDVTPVTLLMQQNVIQPEEPVPVSLK